MKNLPLSIAVATTIILSSTGDILAETPWGATLIVLLTIAFVEYAIRETRKL